jgi:hypothetical protein
MNRPLAPHLQASLLCALAAVVLALPLLWLPVLPGWTGWRPPLVSPRVEAIIAVAAALWTAWCVVDIPRRGLKLLILAGTLWLLASGIWLAGLYGYEVGPLVPLTAATLAGIGGLIFSFSPSGSRRARWQRLVGSRLAPAHLRARINESELGPSPRTESVLVIDLLWPEPGGEGAEHWQRHRELSRRAVDLFCREGAYAERVDGEGARFVFGLWGLPVDPAAVASVLQDWLRKEGGHAAWCRGPVTAGEGGLPGDAHWTMTGAVLNRAGRMALAARSYGARLVTADEFPVSDQAAVTARSLAWWDGGGERTLLREILSCDEGDAVFNSDDLREWENAWEKFWAGEWAAAENGFSALARRKDDAVARTFALRSRAALSASNA